MAFEVFDTTGDGDSWYIVGHHSDELAIAAVRAVVDKRDLEGVVDTDFCVTRGWWRETDPDNEFWDRCGPGDRGAEVFTNIEL